MKVNKRKQAECSRAKGSLSSCWRLICCWHSHGLSSYFMLCLPCHFPLIQLHSVDTTLQWLAPLPCATLGVCVCVSVRVGVCVCVCESERVCVCVCVCE